MSALLEVDGLTVELSGTPVLREVSFALAPGEALALVGESGAGKSMTARTVARLLPPTARVRGAVCFHGTDMLALRGAALRRTRSELGFVFQDPRAHVNPVRTIGDFMTEQLRTMRGDERRTAHEQAVQALVDVGIGDPERRMRQYPHELSGGLLQRVMIAATLLTDPTLILADEPTTALDVTTQAEVMAILDELRRSRNLALLFITHDLDLAAAVCDRVAVMYAGQIVEVHHTGDPARHPYTAALASARPMLGAPTERLAAIPGRPISAAGAGPGCAFAPRCSYAQDHCTTESPELRPYESGQVRCLRMEELAHV